MASRFNVYIMPEDNNQKSPLRILILVILLALSLGSNFFSIALFSSVNLLPGSIFVLITAYVYGIRFGLLAALLSAVPTYYLWGHIWGTPFFVSEALVVSLLLRRRKFNIVSSELVFLIFPGSLICWVFARYGSGFDISGANLIVLKQFLNSIFNAATANIIIYLPFLRNYLPGKNFRHIYMQNLVFSFVSFVFIGTAVIYSALETHYDQGRQFEIFREHIEDSAEGIEDVLTTWREACSTKIRDLAAETAETTEGINSIGLSEVIRLYIKSSMAFDSISILDKAGKVVVGYSAKGGRGGAEAGLDVSDSKYFLHLSKDTDPAKSKLLIMPGKKGELVIVFTAGIYKEKRLVGYCVGMANTSLINKLIGAFSPGKETQYYLVDGNDNVVTYSSTGLRLSGLDFSDSGETYYNARTSGDFKLWLPDNSMSIISKMEKGYWELRHPLKNFGWTVVVRTPAQKIIDTYIAFNKRTLSIVFIALLISCLLIYILSKIIATPIQHLAGISIMLAESEGLGKDEFIDWPRSVIHELHSLIASFKMLLGSKQEYITALNQSNSTILQREEDLNIILDSIGDGVIATDAIGIITRMNPVAETLTAWKAGEALGQGINKVFFLINANDRMHLDDPVMEVIRNRTPLVYGADVKLISKTGLEYFISNNISPVYGYDGEVCGAVIIFRDITESQELQQRLQQSQKMEAIGLLAGGIAHDFNNMLGGILGFAELIEQRVKDDKACAEFCGNIVTTAERAGRLTSQLLSFSRRGKIFSTPFDLHKVIRESVDMLKHSIDKLIVVHTSYKARNSVIKGDPLQLQNTFINFGINARDAMPNGGTLTISTRNARVQEGNDFKTENPLEPGEYIIIEISDTGLGMDKETIAHIYEPFFTTKEIGRGTGLGLSAIYGAVVSHNGAINVFSNPGLGTTFCVFLPVIQQPIEEVEMFANEDRDDSDGTAKSGLVMIVDDEQIICSLASNLLSQLGYQAITCNSPFAALEIFRNRKDEICFVLMDMIMPEMNGSHLFSRLREIRPDVKVILCSGYTYEKMEDTVKGEGYCGFLEKPFKRTQFVETIQSL